MNFDDFCEKVLELFPKYLIGTEFEDASVRLHAYADYQGRADTMLELVLPGDRIYSVDLYLFYYHDFGAFGCDDHTLGRILSAFRELHWGS